MNIMFGRSACGQHIRKLKTFGLYSAISRIIVIESQKKEVTCFNQEGVNWDGNPLTFTVNVPKDKVQALWCGIQIPENAKPGFYKGVVTLTADGISPRSIPVQIEVVEEILADKGGMATYGGMHACVG